MLIFRNLCPNSFFKTSTQQTNRHPKDEHFVGKAANPKKNLSQNRPLEGPFHCVKLVAELFYRQRINPQILRRIFLYNFFSTFLAGHCKASRVFMAFLGKRRITSLQTSTVKTVPPKKRSVGNSTCRARHVCCGKPAMAPRLAFKVKHVLSQKWHCTLSSTYKRSTDLGCKKGNPSLFFYESSSY